MEILRYDADRAEAASRFIRENFEARLKADRAYISWKFGRSPLGSSLGHYYLAMEGGEVVGQVATMADRLLVEGRSHPFVWVVDLMVSPGHRGRGLVALRLLRELTRDHELALVNGMGPEVARLYQGLKWEPVPGASLSTFYGPIRPSRTLTRLAPGVRLALSVLDRPVSRGRRRQAARSTGVERLHGFDEEVDTLVDSVAAVMGPTTFRSSAYYRWRFDERPCGSHRILAVRGGGELRGLVVVKLFGGRPRARWAEVVDVVIDPADRALFRALLAGATAEALAEDCDFVRLSVSHPLLRSALRPPGWVRRRSVAGNEVYVGSRDSSLASTVAGRDWYMTGLISDRADTGNDELAAAG